MIKKLATPTLLASLLAFSIAPCAAQQLAIGLETGLYVVGQDRLGIPLDKASGMAYGLSATYYATDRLAVNGGIRTAQLESFEGVRYYQVPLSVSYSLTRRGMLQAKNLQRPTLGSTLVHLLTLGFVPQTLELEGGAGLGIYSGARTQTEQLAQMMYPGNGDAPTTEVYRATRRNSRTVPSINMGIRWSFHVGQLHLSLRPTYSLLLVEDNRIWLENVRTGEVTRSGSHSGFSVVLGAMWAF